MKLLRKNFHCFTEREKLYKMPIYRIAIGNPGEASQPDALKAALAEFFSMIIFVFAGEGSGMAFSKTFKLNLIWFACIAIYSCYIIWWSND